MSAAGNVMTRWVWSEEAPPPFETVTTTSDVPCRAGAVCEAVAANYRQEFGVEVSADNVVAGPGAKVFEQFFCEAFLDPGDAVLVFTPQFPTYAPNIERRGAH